MYLFLFSDPFHVIGPGEEGSLKPHVGYVFFPFRSFGDLLETIHIVVLLLFCDARGCKDATKHHVTQIHSRRFLQGWNFVPIWQRNSRTIDDGQRSQAFLPSSG